MKPKFNNMKKLMSFSWRSTLLGIVLCTIASGFSPFGAHAVKVYLDDKLVADQYLDFKGNNPTLTLNPSAKYEKLIVKYNECGRTVSDRKITAKDMNNKILKEWEFPGSSTGFEGSMECSVKDIIALTQKSHTVKLFYSSRDFPEGQPFLALLIDNATTASK
jgi:hypothetical protein